MANHLRFVFLLYTCLTKVCSSGAADTLIPNQTIGDEETLISSDQTFELGFFSPGSSKNRYLGIWFKDIAGSVVWIANRNAPLTDRNSTLTIASDGNLILLNKSQHLIWSSNTSAEVQNPVALLQNSGNFVIRDSNSENSSTYWQSFDYPIDSLLAGMKLGKDLETGREWLLTSWKSLDDPSPGDYTYRLNLQVLIQFELLYKGSTKLFRTGIWNRVQYSGTPVSPNPVSKTVPVFEGTKIYSSYETVDSRFVTTVVLNQTTGTVQRMIANRGSNEWTTMYTMTIPNDPCDKYGQCGANGICRLNSDPICDCLEGYKPDSLLQWGLLNRTGGCVRTIQTNCSDKVGFHRVSWVKMPDMVDFSVNKNMSLSECRSECSKNCSCKAFCNSDVRGRGSGCIMWFGNLMDIKEFKDTKYKQDLYIRLTAAETRMHSGLTKAAKVAIIAAVSGFSTVLILGLLVWTILRKRQMNKRGIKSNRDDIDLPFFDMAAISAATNNFSQTNVLGVGGFGPVYKGCLPTGQEIAVKRLSKTSGQGIEEFMNEVHVIARLQHKNLVALLGCCIEGEEKILIYEYMPNKSLDNFIFDHDRSYLLEWGRRFDIAVGVARGLLYLHQDSKLRIIHRDLKTSNILLDENLQPKISDFGLARIFVGDVKEARTRRVIGTYGYMSPEYAFDGKFSTTSDVYSYGVLLLEIVSGKKNRGFCHPNHHHNLLGHAWLLWKEGRSLELMDPCLDDSSVEFQVERCIQVSLLCVQKYPQDRPEMSSVVFMLINEEAVLGQPTEPGFFMERLPPSTRNSNEEDSSTGNKLTVTMLDGR